MSLQVRLRHTLGERLLELPDRPVDEPVVVGRWSGADVQVPSVTVSQRHCVLFVHDGRWAVQATGGASGTYVNGSKVEGPAFLSVGDVITLGGESNAPAVEIDPLRAAQGKKGRPAGTVGIAAAPAAAPAPAAPSAYAAQPAHPPQPSYPAPTVAQGYGYAAPTQPPATYAAPPPAAGSAWDPSAHATDAAAGGGGDTIAWPVDPAGTSTYYARRRPRRSSSGTALGLFLTVLIVGGAGYFVYRNYQQQQEQTQVTPQPAPQVSPPRVLPPTTAPRPDEDTSQAPGSIFEKGSPGSRAAKAASRPATRVARAQPGTVLPGAPMEGPPADDGSNEPTIGVVEALPQDAADATTQPGAEADDPAWKQVQAARFSQDEAKAILKFDEYARTHPDRFAAQLTEYADKAMDRLWFERLEQLCRQREETKKNIAQAEKEMTEETDDAYKKRVLIPLKEKYLNRLQTLEEELKTEMKYDAPAAPNLLDDAQVDKLRRQRDPAYYEGWKNRVLTYIRRSHGELPWGQS